MFGTKTATCFTQPRGGGIHATVRCIQRHVAIRKIAIRRLSAAVGLAVFEHGFYPLAGGVRFDQDGTGQPIFSQLLEIMATDQVAALQVEYDPKTLQVKPQCPAVTGLARDLRTRRLYRPLWLDQDQAARQPSPGPHPGSCAQVGGDAQSSERMAC